MRLRFIAYNKQELRAGKEIIDIVTFRFVFSKLVLCSKVKLRFIANNEQELRAGEEMID